MDELIKSLEVLAETDNERFFRSLEPRKLAELEFHDRHSSPEFAALQTSDTFDRFYGNRKYYLATRRSRSFTEAWIQEHAKDSIFLDLACGTGKNAIEAGKHGARLSIGIDLSSVRVTQARQSASQLGMQNVKFAQADAENTQLPDSSIDAVICSGILHHMDLSYVIPEIRRILRPGGRMLAVEALDYNPLIKLYRRLTPDMRTEWEKAHILSLHDVRFMAHFLEVNRVRYWHPVSYVAAKLPGTLGIWELIDRALERVPMIQLLSWIFTIEATKPEGARQS